MTLMCQCVLENVLSHSSIIRWSKLEACDVVLAGSAVTTANDEVDQVKLLEAVKRYRPHSVRLSVSVSWYNYKVVQKHSI